MTKLLSILIKGILLISTNPITELKVTKPQTKEEARKLIALLMRMNISYT